MEHCTWIVQVPSGNPEPDSEADCWSYVDCGAAVTEVGVGWECEAGHSYKGIEEESRLDWIREQEDRNSYR